MQSAAQTNSFIESWIGSLKRECLNLFFCFSLRQLDFIVQAYGDYYNQFRPHQSLGNRPPEARDDPPEAAEIKPETIRCYSWLGGLLRHYYREAA